MSPRQKHYSGKSHAAVTLEKVLGLISKQLYSQGLCVAEGGEGEMGVMW